MKGEETEKFKEKTKSRDSDGGVTDGWTPRKEEEDEDEGRKSGRVVMSLVRAWNSLKAAIVLIKAVNEQLMAVMDATLQLQTPPCTCLTCTLTVHAANISHTFQACVCLCTHLSGGWGVSLV